MAHPLLRYTLLQIPGIIFLGAALSIALERDWIVAGTAAWVIGFWVLKDVALYPLYRPALMRTRQGSAAAALEGACGRTHSEVAERGVVVVTGEYWRACSASDPIPDGVPVRVRGSRGRLLVVERDDSGNRG